MVEVISLVMGPPAAWSAVGVVELVGSTGLIVGWRRRRVGRVAAAGLALLMGGALGAYFRVGDWSGAAVLGVATTALAAGIRP